MRFPFIGKRPPIQPDLEKEGDKPLPTDAEVKAYLENGPKQAEAPLATPINEAPNFSNETSAPIVKPITAKNDTRVLVGAGESKG